jgi:hypothetical protein
MGKKIKIKCLKCGDVIQSMFRNDFRWCSCRNIFIDGGNDYLRYGGNIEDEDSYIFITEEVEDE